MSSTSKRKKKTSKEEPEILEFSTFVSLDTPDIFYKVQELLQTAGIVLINLETGRTISGQVNLPEIGLIDTAKNRPIKTELGFIRTPLPQSRNFDNVDIDAVLIVKNDSIPGEPSFFEIKVVEDGDVERWAQLAYDISTEFAILVENRHLPTVIMGITSLCAPDEKDPQSARIAAIRLYQKYGFDDLYAVASEEIPYEEDFYDDDEGDE